METEELREKIVNKTMISLSEYNDLKDKLEPFKKIPPLALEVALLDKAIDRLEVYC